jgi:enoyl-CoA hydratase/carnithine racemase
MTGGRTVEFSVADGLGVIRLNRPDARNAIDQALVDDLYEAVQRCAADSAVRALLIRGEGPSFTVGGDVTMFARTGPGELLRRRHRPRRRGHQVPDRVRWARALRRRRGTWFLPHLVGLRRAAELDLTERVLADGDHNRSHHGYR